MTSVQEIEILLIIAIFFIILIFVKLAKKPKDPLIVIFKDDALFITNTGDTLVYNVRDMSGKSLERDIKPSVQEKIVFKKAPSNRFIRFTYKGFDYLQEF